MSHTPHLRVPFRIVGAAASVVEDGSDAELVQNVTVLLGTRPGERLVVPEYGVGDPTFGFMGATPDESEIRSAVARYEPRAEVVVDHGPPSDTGDATVTVRVARIEEA